MKKLMSIVLAVATVACLMSSCGVGGDGSGTTVSTTPHETTTVPETTPPPAETPPGTDSATDSVPVTSPDETSVPQPPVEGIVQDADEFPNSALEFTFSTEKDYYKDGETVDLNVMIKNRTLIGQKDLSFALSVPAGLKIISGATITADEIAAGGEIEHKVTLAVDSGAAAVGTATPGTRTPGRWYADYSKNHKIGINGNIVSLTFNGYHAVNADPSLVGTVNIGTLNAKGSALIIDDIKIVANSDGRIIYENDFESADAMDRDLEYIIFNNIKAGYDNADPASLKAAWSIVENDGNKALYVACAETDYGPTVQVANLDSLCDYTFTFRFLDGDGGGQFCAPRVGVQVVLPDAKDKVTCQGYQWVLGGWNNSKTVFQQYRLKADGSAMERPAVCNPEYATFSYTDWLDCKLVVTADKLSAYVDGELYLEYSPVEK